MKNRLEQLDDIEEGSVKETLNLNQVEYLRKIEELNQNLIKSWDNDQRVKALKIAIQVCACVHACLCVCVHACVSMCVIYLMISPLVCQTTNRYKCDPVLSQ